MEQIFLPLSFCFPVHCYTSSSNGYDIPFFSYYDLVVGQLPEQWCIADEQTTDEVLQSALDWACGKGGADCSKIQVHQPCYFPNTVRDHASYAFNSYWQRLKHKGGSCYFNGAAFVTEVNPSKISTPPLLHLLH